jgi:hypothetical protein
MSQDRHCWPALPTEGHELRPCRTIPVSSCLPLAAPIEGMRYQSCRLGTDPGRYGWFVDPTPAQDEEFTRQGHDPQLHAVDPRAVDRIAEQDVWAGSANLEPSASGTRNPVYGLHGPD